MENTRYKILLVEDNKLDQTAFKRLVRNENLPYDYTIAGSVSQARDILASNEFDIVVSDYSLGDGTGFEILNSIAETPVILATGAGDEELAVKAMKAGACDYLIKDPGCNYIKVLPEIIKNSIRHKKAEQELKKYHDNLETLVKERTEQLAAEKELLSVTLSSMGDGVVAVDVEKRIILFNQVAENLLGWKFEEVQDKPIDEIFRVINEQTKLSVESPIDRVFSTNRTETEGNHNALIARDGTEYPVSTTAAPIRKNDGTMIGIVMVLRDVSQEREINRMKTDFISSVSHELRTPLTSIKACIETILSDPDMPEQTRHQFLTIVDEESNRLASLIEDLLEISRIESGSTKITREAVDIVDIAERVCSALQPLADKKNIQLKVDIEEEISQLQADKSKMQSAITNLVSNAIKFTDHGDVHVLVRCQDKELLIRVSDTGMGIPREALGKIFGRFYRVHHPGKQIQGTGLGLAIVKKIVMMHDGRIEVESEVDKGSTFTIFLPLTALPAQKSVSVN